MESSPAAGDAGAVLAQARTSTVQLGGWGRYPMVEGHEEWSEDLQGSTQGAALTRGLGRSYGDASLPACTRDRVVNSSLADRFITFDPDTGVLRAEAGCPLWRVNRVFLPRGWFTPVTPGTHYVTLGGMVAADVHGKSHHRDGCFGEHVTLLKLRVADGRIVECSDEAERDLFRATLGGMGLTGHILEVAFRLRRIPSPWIWQESERTPNFEATLSSLQAAKTWPFTVCWADFLNKGSRAGRGIVMKGRWAEPHEAPKAPPSFRRPVTVPFVFPNWFLQPWMVQVFNWLNYLKHGPRLRAGIIHPETFWYPLDTVQYWNRVYGRRGFTQYQCVLPVDGGWSRHRAVLELLQRHRAPVFLCVIKDCGAEGRGTLSFPKPGISYALDMPVAPSTQPLVDALNEFVIAEGGRVYLAKDAFTRAEHFRAMEPRLDAWERVRRTWDPQRRLRSAQSVRLFGDQP